MAKQVKIDRVADLRERIAGSQAMLVTEYRGMTVHETAELRRSLRGAASFAVVKNTLLKRAADEAGIDDGFSTMLAGPTAVAFVTGDVVAAAKKIADAQKSFPALVLKGGWVEGRVLDERGAKALSSLDSREVMLSKVAGMLQSEMVRAASMFQALQGRFLSLLEAYKEKVPGEAIAAAPAVEASADVPAPAPEAEPVADGEPTGDEPAAEAAVEGEE